MKGVKIALEIIEFGLIIIGTTLTIYGIIVDQFDFIPKNITGIIIFILCILLIIIVIHKVIIITKKPLIECNGFPYKTHRDGGKRMCSMVEYCLSTDTEYAKDHKSIFLNSESKSAKKLFDAYFNEISKFLCCAQFDLIMTLPKNPYYHLDENRYDLFRDTMINAIKSKAKTKEKIIWLSSDDFNSFKSNLKDEIIKNIENIKHLPNYRSKHKKIYLTDFEKYLDLHKGMPLTWHKDATKSPIEECIIIDKCASIACDSEKIIISFSNYEINKTHDTIKNNIGEKLSTADFFTQYIIPEFEKDTTISENNKKYCIAYLRRIK